MERDFKRALMLYENIFRNRHLCAVTRADINDIKVTFYFAECTQNHLVSKDKWSQIPSQSLVHFMQLDFTILRTAKVHSVQRGAKNAVQIFLKIKKNAVLFFSFCTQPNDLVTRRKVKPVEPLGETFILLRFLVLLK